MAQSWISGLYHRDDADHIRSSYTPIPRVAEFSKGGI